MTLGRDLLEKEFKRHNLKFGNYVKSEEIKKVFTEYAVNSLDDLISQVGYGRVSPRQVVNHFLAEESAKDPEQIKEQVKKKTATASPSLGISLTGY